MDRSRAWVLNLDAEDELAHTGGATMSAATRARLGSLRGTLAALLLPGDVVIPEDGSVRLPRGAYHGRAWCPTPRALRALSLAGTVLPEAPSRAVLRAANHRWLCASLGQTLPGGCWATTMESVARTVASESVGHGWLLKRPLGYAGRGRLRVTGSLDPPAEAWVKASLRTGEGIQMEPWVERLGDHGLHGWISREGEVTWGAPTVQVCDAHGAWQSSRRAEMGELTAGEGEALARAAREAVEALRALGYWGPVGVDAFRWRDRAGVVGWNPRCEINARYSMGWAVGMEGRRVDG